MKILIFYLLLVSLICNYNNNDLIITILYSTLILVSVFLFMLKIIHKFFINYKL